MSKLTAAQIEDRAMRACDALYRAHKAGEINDAQFELGMREIAQWSFDKYQRLPQTEAVDAITGLLLGKSGERK